MQIAEHHPKGNFIRFGMLFMTPDLVKIKEMTGSISPHHNFLRLFEEVNRFISDKMSRYGSRSCFGSYKKHVGMSSKLKNWKGEAWEGFTPSQPKSILSCNKLTLEYQLKRSRTLVQSIFIFFIYLLFFFLDSSYLLKRVLGRD